MIKKILIPLIGLIIIVSCKGESKGAADLAQEVCDCYVKANKMDANDPQRAKIQADCLATQGMAWNKVKDDPKKSEEFNRIIGNCGKEILKETLK
ncbi:MAG TPA: hypothetical protein VFV31_00440 [Chitinophagaceae bacterium]|nr:hypothetical protein [Chitinophagaceae bacterium]